MTGTRTRLFDTCCQKGRNVGLWARNFWRSWLFPVTGLCALVWFLVRVAPKPSRATYPCQRVAGPLASSFLLWLLGVSGIALAFRRAWERVNRMRYLYVGVGAAIALVGLGWALLGAERPAGAGYPPHPPNTPIGVARGLHPGRVAWVHDPAVTDWAGPGSGERWHEHVDQGVADEMMSQGLQAYSGEISDTAAWNALFAHHNGGSGYEAGQKIMIKINLTTANAGSGSACDDGHYNQTECSSVSFDSTANSPQMMHALLDQLVHVVGVLESDISIGDPTGLFVNYLFNPLYDDFPGVNYLDNRGGEGEPGEWRTRAEYTDPCVPYYWSTSAADGKTQDCLLTVFDEATYVINFSVLKSHNCGGISVAAKNHYGSMLRTPVGGGRTLGGNHYNLHYTLPGDGCRDSDAMKQMGQYRALVDLMGMEGIGGKTILVLVDGIFGGRDWYSVPSLWSLSPFDGDWPSSLLVSMDPVAIDTVAHDFLVEQWPEQVLRYEGVQDYLHEAALANEAPSGTCYDPERDGVCMDSLGTHEHWNNPTDKQYSRNLDPENGLGIELVYVGDSPPPAPAAPASLTASASPALGIELTWQDNASNESGFRIERSGDQGLTWTEIDIVGADVTSYNDEDATCGREAHYRVRAYRSGDGQYSEYSNIAQASPDSGTAQMDLDPGWNLISWALEPFDPSLEAVLQPIDGRYCRVLGERGVYDCSLASVYATLSELHGGRAYYLRIEGTEMATLRVAGVCMPAGTALSLHEGWNWIGYLPSTNLPIADALQSIGGKYLLVHSLDQTYDPAEPLYSTLSQMGPGLGYLIRATEAVDLVYPGAQYGAMARTAGPDKGACGRVRPTPHFAVFHGKLTGGDGHPAPVGTVVEALTPGGQVAGCFQVQHAGQYGYMRIYGQEAASMIPGFRVGELVAFQVDGHSAGSAVDLFWRNDLAPQTVDLVMAMGYPAYLPLVQGVRQ